jgi:acyl carrier protein
MNRDEILVRLRSVFSEVFDDDSLVFSDSLGRDTLKAWDSLGHIRLIAAIEDEFGIHFTIQEIEQLTTVGHMLELIGARF